MEDASNNGKHSIHSAIDEVRFQRIESEQLLLRRDYTSLVGDIREIRDRSREISALVAQGLSKADIAANRLDVIEELMKKISRGTTTAKKKTKRKGRR